MRIENLTIIEKPYISDKNKAGEEFKTQRGKKYWKIAMKTDLYKNEWLTGFIWENTDPMFNLKSGDQLSVIIERNGNYLNFRIPRKMDYLEMRLENLENELKELKELITTPDERIVKNEAPDMSEDISNVPF